MLLLVGWALAQLVVLPIAVVTWEVGDAFWRTIVVFVFIFDAGFLLVGLMSLLAEVLEAFAVLASGLIAIGRWFQRHAQSRR